MGLRLHSQFLDALAVLSQSDQKRVRVALQQLGDVGASRGLRPHPVGNFMSFSATMDLRILAVSEPDGYTLVHVDHHDDAYRWGERHDAILGQDDLLIAVLPSGARPQPAQEFQRTKRTSPFSIFAGLPKAVAAMLDSASNDEELLDAISALSPEWQQMALALSNGGVSAPAPSDIIAVDDELLQFALAMPAEKWRVFLHPSQRAIVDLPGTGNLLVRGGPGTGKTVCLVHRFVRLSAARPENPPLLIALNGPAREALEQACKSLGHFPATGTIVDFRHLDQRAGFENLAGGSSAVLIDEGQDLPVGVIARLIENLEKQQPMPPLTIAYDPNQAIVEPSGDALARLQAFTDTVTLTYCYRLTNEILRYSAAVLGRLHSNFSGKNFQHQHHIDSRRDAGSALMIAAVTGPEVEQVVVDEPEIEEAAVGRALALKRETGSWEGIGVVVVGDSSSTIKNLSAQGVPARSASEVKGLEFFRGIVVDRLPPQPTGGGPSPITAAGYRAQSGLYVAVTRFRDKVTILTPHPSRLVEGNRD